MNETVTGTTRMSREEVLHFLESDAAATERFMWWWDDYTMDTVPIYSPPSSSLRDIIDHWEALGFIHYDGINMNITSLGRDLLKLTAI